MKLLLHHTSCKKIKLKTKDVKQQVPKIVSDINSYLQNSLAGLILLKPMKFNILEAHGQVLSISRQTYSTVHQKNEHISLS